MSVVVEFFVAPDDASAALTLRTGPGEALEAISFGNLDPEEAVVEWECLLAGGSFEELVEAGEPRRVADEDGGCVVFALSLRLSTALADAEDSAVRDVFVSWAQLAGASIRRSPARSWVNRLSSPATPGAGTGTFTAGPGRSSRAAAEPSPGSARIRPWEAGFAVVTLWWLEVSAATGAGVSSNHPHLLQEVRETRNMRHPPPLPSTVRSPSRFHREVR